jgi:uncharacterized protein (TIGR00725 family)
MKRGTEQTSSAVAVFGSSGTTPGSSEWIAAERCGRLLAERGLTVVTGGYGGAMHAVSAGAATAGGRVVGVTAPTVFPGRTGANPYVAIERPAPSLTKRIHDMVSTTAASIALPGSIGTFTELMVAWNVAFVARFNGASPAPVVAVGEVWRELIHAAVARLATDGSLVDFVDDVDGAVEIVATRLTT